MAAGTPYSQVLFNTREELVSSDINAEQNLISRDVQNTISAAGSSVDSAVAIPGSTSFTDMLTANGGPISGLDVAPTFAGSGGLTATIGAGSGYSYYPTGLSANYSPYQVLRWGASTVTFATGAGQPRIDTVYAQPATAVSVTAARNVLVDPVTRTVTVQSVNKQADPLANVGVVTGVAAATPVPNAAGLAGFPGAVPLFYVYVPPGAAATNNFFVCRGTWRRAQHPFSSMNGVLEGMGLKWDLTVAHGSSTSVKATAGLHRIIIDGEVLEFVAEIDSNHGNVIQDSTGDPFAGAAPATASQPYYIYAIGGRHYPFPTFNSGVNALSPVTLVESTIAPDFTSGHPTAVLTTPNGTIQTGAVYVGLGFVVQNTTNRQSCIMSERYTWFSAFTGTGNSVTVTKAGGGVEQLSAPAAPLAFRTEALITMTVTTGGATSSLTILPDNGTGASALSAVGALASCHFPASSTAARMVGPLPWPPGTTERLYVNGGNAGDVVTMTVQAYAHRARIVGNTAVQN